MKWTTLDPIEGQKYIVETSNGSIFPAHIINGNSWWNTEKGFPIECVVRWIPYPSGDNVNDEIPIEVLFKYVCRDYKNMKEIAKGESDKVSTLKNLNKELVSDCGTLCDEVKRMKEDLANKDRDHTDEINKLYDLIHELSAERDALKEQLNQPMPQSDPSKDLLRENKQMKAFLRSIMNTCDTVRELEIA